MEQSLNNLTQHFRELFQVEKQDIRSYSPLDLAYIGDAVYELVIRSYIMDHGNVRVNRMHSRASSLVKAGTQAALIMILEEELTEEEHSVYKRGRNAKSYTTAKNASISDYRKATGFEALMGYLYLDGQYERILELVHRGLEKLELLY